MCLLHEIAQALADRVKRSIQTGDLGSAFLNGALGTIVGHVDQQALGRIFSEAARARRAAPAARPRTQSRPQVLGHWEILGLDSAVATENDVRRVQRELAKIYHVDKGSSAVAAGKMAAVNQAATRCVAELRRRRAGDRT